MTSAAEAVAGTKSKTRFRRTYPGHPSQVGQVRHDLADLIAGLPLADELLLVASELCANAVVHSRSGGPGGRFTVLANVYPGQSVWIEVIDQGGVWRLAKQEDDRRHGLDIVRSVVGDTNWGVDGDGSFARVVWVRLRCPGN